MGLLKHFRSRSRLKDIDANGPQAIDYSSYPPMPSTPARFGRDHTTRLPEKVLNNVFTYICPHTTDRSYQPSEESSIGDGCMLCDLRDLAGCAQVCRRWYGIAQKVLYTSVRIDAVHYCALEEELAEKRKKAGGHWRKRSVVVEPVDVPNIRLQLFAKTVRLQPQLAGLVQIVKLPYMTRETAKGDLARAVSALPSLRYVDLPDGFFSGDASCMALRQELQSRCPDIRKMSYRAGSEEALELLAHRHWQSIEVLELSALAIEPATLRIVLASLPTLRELTLSEMEWVDDSIYNHSPGQLPDFPPLQTLKLIDIPNITGNALKTYLHAPINRSQLLYLTLQNTGITVQDLPQVLWAASSLQHLSVTETVTKSLALSTHELPPLTSISLKTLHFEITSSEDVHGLQKPAESYYAYLASSLHQNALPALETLYVRDQNFPDLLLVPDTMSGVPPMPPLPRPSNATGPGGGGTHMNGSETGSLRSKQSNISTSTTSKNLPQHHAGFGATPGGGGFTQTLAVFSKGIDELEWVVTAIAPPSPQDKHSHSRNRSIGSSSRPLSAYSAARGLGPQWAQGGFGGEARKSVVVGNGFGGFLAIPQEEAPRPMTSDGGGGRWGSVASQGSGGMGLRPPPSLAGSSKDEKRGSRHDLWR
ncbi:hypothetical protein LTR37_017072 [Vermiconidia calcicola]|uniref:Uncharacterized protein n=1 Tax=Vermiconidia calcicola TaxID=1690605 RepID=A0ACC3MLA3_9PEZI|nr:hypothetical protein LTR37_017072 [Vermiconidia calcicola]